LEMNVRDDQKLVEIWLTNAEKIDPVLREGLKEIYAKYKTKKYMVAVFESGKGDLYENTRDLLLFKGIWIRFFSAVPSISLFLCYFQNIFILFIRSD
jgi:hypothetical protein